MASISNVSKGDWELPFLPRKQCDTSNPYCVMRHAGLEASDAPCEFDALCHRYSQQLQHLRDNPTSTLPSGPWWGGMSTVMLNVLQHRLEHSNAKAFESLARTYPDSASGGVQKAVSLAERKRLLANKRKLREN